MALQPKLTPYLRNLSAAKSNVRTFAAAAAQASSASDYLKPREGVKTSRVGNVMVASIETNQPMSKLAVFVRAGSRFETDETQGTLQMLRIAAGLGTNGSSQYGLTRTIEQVGGNFSCTAGREYISYTVESTRNKIADVSRFLIDSVMNQAFKPWELKDNVQRLRLDRVLRPPEVRVLELLHKAAYRKGLGYSIYSPKWMVGNHTSDMLLEFVNNNFNQASVVGIGLPHELVASFGSRMSVSGEAGKTVPAKFTAGTELRKETADGLAYVALAIEGGAIGKPKEAVASALAQRVLGSGPRTKRGLNTGGKLAQSVMSINELEISATAINANYSDSGLLGVVVATNGKLIGDATRKAASTLRSPASDEEVTRAKNQLKTDLGIATESDQGTLEELGLQTLLQGQVSSLQELHSLVDSVSAADVNAIVTKGNLSMAAFGKVANVPHIDEL